VRVSCLWAVVFLLHLLQRNITDTRFFSEEFTGEPVKDSYVDSHISKTYQVHISLPPTSVSHAPTRAVCVYVILYCVMLRTRSWASRGKMRPSTWTTTPRICLSMPLREGHDGNPPSSPSALDIL
jgi:hypothetical protein